MDEALGHFGAQKLVANRNVSTMTLSLFTVLILIFLIISYLLTFEKVTDKISWIKDVKRWRIFVLEVIVTLFILRDFFGDVTFNFINSCF